MSSGMGGGGRGQSPKRVKSEKVDGEYRGEWPDWLWRVAEKMRAWMPNGYHEEDDDDDT